MAAERTKKSPAEEETASLTRFHEGSCDRAYDFLGCHRQTLSEGGFAYTFRTWAPRAKRVQLVGDFVGWEEGVAMTLTEGDLWTYVYTTPHTIDGSRYKFKVVSQKGAVYKADPYAVFSETREHTASIVCTESDFVFQDATWLKKRSETVGSSVQASFPLHIYEMHLASWHTRGDSSNHDGRAYLSYREIAELLVPYVKKMGYTHVLLLPIAEYPFDASWGYQTCGYFAPTSRHGTPDDFRYFVNKLHTNGIGVLLDWTGGPFPKDEHGLYAFDGAPLYEAADETGEQGTVPFDLGRGEVQSFLLSNALFWLREYHLDGLCMRALKALFRSYTTEKNREAATAFVQKLGDAVAREFPDVLWMAGETPNDRAATETRSSGGLGFSLQEKDGWTADWYTYLQCDPFFRHGCHNKLTDSLNGATSTHALLSLSHDGLTQGKKALLDKMFGSYEQKFAQVRLFLTYLILHPGKKMTFMGCEFGQWHEWDHEQSLEWFLLHYDNHAKLHRFVGQLNQFYLSHAALWELDHAREGFEWIDSDRANDNLLAFIRRDASGRELVALFNFSARPYLDYSVKVKGDAYCEVFSTAEESFGGEGDLNKGVLRVENERIRLNLAPLSAVILQPQADGTQPNDANGTVLK